MLTFINDEGAQHTCANDHEDILRVGHLVPASNGVYVPKSFLKLYENNEWPKKYKGIPVTVGNTFYEYINQALRYCVIIKVTHTRFRIEYELPNSGMTGSWRYHTDSRYTPVKS